MVKEELLLGPILIAVVLNVLLYGVCLSQFSIYCTSGYQERRVIKLLVAWVLLLDTFHTGATVYLLWNYVITNFNNTASLITAPWPFSSTPMITVLASCPIELFLAWRIKLFSESWWIFGALAALALAQATLGIVSAVGALRISDIEYFFTLIPVVDAWLGLTVTCDLAITILLMIYLSKSRTGCTHTDNIITRLIRSSVETAAFGSFFCVMDLVMFTTLQNTNFHVIFAFPLGRIYTNTLLATLNSRASLRTELRDSVCFTSAPFMSFTHTVITDNYLGTQTNTPGSHPAYIGPTHSEAKGSTLDPDVESAAMSEAPSDVNLTSELRVNS